MKYVIQRPGTEEFQAVGGGYTYDSAKAKTYDTRQEARDECCINEVVRAGLILQGRIVIPKEVTR